MVKPKLPRISVANPKLKPQVPLQSLPKNCPLTIMLSARVDDNKIAAREILGTLLDQVEENLKIETELERKEALQTIFESEGDFVRYSSYPPTGQTIQTLQCQQAQNSTQFSTTADETFYEGLRMSKEKVTEIALKTVKQADRKESCRYLEDQSPTGAANLWMAVRKQRISASVRAHSVKTRRDRNEELAQRFVCETGRSLNTPAVLKGIQTEPIALRNYESVTNQKATKLGVVVCQAQPWLCCSPDSVVMCTNGIKVVEVKCPSLVDDQIFNHAEKKINVAYLKYSEKDKSEIILNPSHQYYTQVQICMYVLNANLCDFFVYTSKQYVLVKIPRNEEWLQAFIPKIEQFYFAYFLPLLRTRQD